MVNILPPGSLWSQISNLSFFLSGLFNDLLVIRVALTAAYAFLLVQAILGFPSWELSFAGRSGNIALDTIVWSCINILVHGCGVLRMYYDEREINLTKEEAALWRYIYRQSGMSKAEFKGLICPTLQLLSFDKGDAIPTANWFCIIYDGIVNAEVAHKSGVDRKIEMYSGEMFPIEHLYLEHMPQESHFSRTRIKPIAATPVRLFGIPKATLKYLSINHSTHDAWMAMLIASLAEIVERPYRGKTTEAIQTNAQITDSVLGAEINPLFNPLEASEEPDPLSAGSTKAWSMPIRHLLKYAKMSFYVPWPLGVWPVGLRHALPPPVDPNVAELRKRISSWRLSDSLASSVSNNEPIAVVDKVVGPHVLLKISEEEQQMQQDDAPEARASLPRMPSMDV